MTRKPKPLPWFASLNQPPRSPAHGRNRRPNSPTHRNPTNGASDSAGAVYAFPAGITYANWATRTIIAPEPAPIPHAGIRAGELIGYRMWIVKDNYELCSLAHYFIWNPGAVIEGKIDELVSANFFNPLFGGVYSYAEPSSLVKELNDIERAYLFPAIHYLGDCPCKVIGVAVGTIKCWGEVVEHEKGYRAQYARLQSINSVIGAIDIYHLRARYNV